MPRPCNAITIRYECASILREMQANAVPAVPALIDALSDDQLSVRMSAAFAVGVIRDHWPKSDPARTNYDAQAVNALVKLMSDPNGEAQGNAAGSIQFFGDAATNAIPALVEIANKGSGYGRWKSIETLIEIKGVTPDMTPMLKIATRSSDRNVATTARRALDFLNSQTKPDVGNR
jgi:HEAT repeat protein